jgi:hypothetical protein
MINDLKSALLRLPGVKDVTIEFNEVNIQFINGSHLSFKAEGPQGTELYVDIENVVKYENKFKVE